MLSNKRQPESNGAPAADGGAAAGGIAVGTCFAIIVVLSILGAIAIALGVGLGVGLQNSNYGPNRNNNNNNNNNGADTTAAITTTPSTTTPLNPNIAFFGLTNQNQLFKFNTQNLTVFSSVNITGLQGATMLSIDFRPATGQLYGISNSTTGQNTTKLWVINPDTGAATLIGLPPNPLNNSARGNTGVAVPPVGSIISIDFNPATDELRVVTSPAGINQRVNVTTPAGGGTAQIITQTDAPIGGNLMLAVAYSNNSAGVTTTTLFDIDSVNDVLVQQTPPSAGTIVQVGTGLGQNFVGPIGFDIAPNGLALASTVVADASQLYLVNLTSGLLSQHLGNLTQTLIALAIPTDPVAYAITADGLSLLTFNPHNSTIPPVTTAIKFVSALVAGEVIVGMDFNPSTGQLFILSSASNLSGLNPATGATVIVGPTIRAIPGNQTGYGFDFNPNDNTIWIVSSGNNSALSLTRPTVAGGPLTATLSGPAFTGTNPTAAAFSSTGTPTVVTFFYINTPSTPATAQLFSLRVSPAPIPAAYTPVGPGLGIGPVQAANGFHIGFKSGTAYALLTVDTVTSLYQIDLVAGTATILQPFVQGARAFTVGLGF